MLSTNPWFCFIDVTTKILAKQYNPVTLDRLEEEMNHALVLIERFPCISTGIGVIQNFTMMFIVSIMQTGDRYGTRKDHWSKSCMIRSTGAAIHHSCANCSSWWLNAISHDHLQGDTSSEANNTWRCPRVCMCWPWPGWIKKEYLEHIWQPTRLSLPDHNVLFTLDSFKAHTMITWWSMVQHTVITGGCTSKLQPLTMFQANLEGLLDRLHSHIHDS